MNNKHSKYNNLIHYAITKNVFKHANYIEIENIGFPKD